MEQTLGNVLFASTYGDFAARYACAVCGKTNKRRKKPLQKIAARKLKIKY